MSVVSLPIELDLDAIADFCRRNHIRKLSLFGSVLREDFRPESDVDVLVEFEAEAEIGLFEMMGMEDELSVIVGRRVDLGAELSPYVRDEALREAVVIYAVPQGLRPAPAHA